MFEFKKLSRIKLLMAFLIIIATIYTFEWVEAQPVFCNVCHEMNYFYDTWSNSTHASVANCLDCHTEPGVEGFIDEKIRALNELVIHIIGDYEVPVNTGVRVNNEICLSCHSGIEELDDEDDIVRHDVHDDKGVMCTDCHSNVVHSILNETKVMPFGQCDNCHLKHQTFPMIESHGTLSCDKCHIDGIYDSKLSSKCENCHAAPKDHTGGGLTNCDVCHTLREWEGEINDHSEQPLLGGHYGRNCSSCHKSSDFNNTPNNCNACHSISIYHFNTSEKCESCHNVSGWTPAVFDHSFYNLTGEHSTLKCLKCHQNGKYEETQKLCESCHKSPNNHIYNLTTSCDVCHTNKGWNTVQYDHSEFPLNGGHTSIACSRCHLDSNYSNVSKSCSSCHTNPLKHAAGNTTNCESCHSILGWEPTTYDHSEFPLTDAHKEVECLSCHKNNTFNETLNSCISCHKQPSSHIESSQNCLSCHTTERWIPSTFNHSSSIFSGSHLNRQCIECHTDNNYNMISTSCSSCHNSPSTHSGLNQPCNSCHSMVSFTPSTFIHPKEGPHISKGEHKLPCSSCHNTVYAVASCTGNGCHSKIPKDD